jgi:SAM-dependent methyltransferase
MTIDRRTLFALTGASAAAAVSPAWATPKSPATDVAGKADVVESFPRGWDGRLKRLPTLDVESNQEFLTEFRSWVQTAPNGLMQTARLRAVKVFEENGYAPDAELPIQQVAALMEKDPTLMASARAWLATQQLTWNGVKAAFDADLDRHLSELKAAEKKGPGTLELAPAMFIPDYAKHEIHIMPGGYVGDPLAGYIYYYGTNNFYMGHNNHDEENQKLAGAVPVPADGKVRRILDVGCSVGRTTMALKERFPEAEVWGVDVGGPMVQYAHMRATDLGSEVHFRQMLGEKMDFPDGHFDMIFSYIILHEIPNKVNTQIMREISRLLRSGGTYYPVDFFTANKPPKDAYGKFRRWWDHRWNNEVWALEHLDYDLEGDLRAAGMQVDPKGPPASPGGKPNLSAIKLA